MASYDLGSVVGPKGDRGDTGGVNPNLLDNWYFGNPVNQRGQTEYTGTGYTIDRWKMNCPNLIVDSENNCITFSVSASTRQGIWQVVDNAIELSGKTVTFSALAKMNSGSTGYLLCYNTDTPAILGSKVFDNQDYSVVSFTFVAPDNFRAVGIHSNSNSSASVSIIAAKLELGSTQTLAHQDADGNWVLNEIPDYNVQVLRCHDFTSNDAHAAGLHNSIYRGKMIGTAATTQQWRDIGNGTFNDMFIGDYWTINSINWRIAAFDYFYRAGDTECTAHHVVIVPDTALYTAKMNDTDTTTGGYVGSAMRTTNLEQAKTIINNAFGSTHILPHREILTNAVANGVASGWAWTDSTVELMSEAMVYGDKFGGINYFEGGVANSQFPLFRYRKDLISNRINYWLRGVGSASVFARVNSSGVAARTTASSALGVRPAFAIYNP